MVGLGNPGQDYAGTRHNVGAECVELLAGRHGVALRHRRGSTARTAEAVVDGRRLALAVPTIYMNESGAAVAPLLKRFGIDQPEHLVVVHDELDLDPGRVKVKIGGGLAGNNGLRSVRDHLHTADFGRVRIGVGKPPSRERGADHVLGRPAQAQRVELDLAVVAAADAVELILAGGVAAAQEQVNRS